MIGPSSRWAGLSPNQVRRLLECDWEDEYGPRPPEP